MNQIPSRSDTARTIHQYESQRRLQMLRIIILPFILLATVLLIAVIIAFFFIPSDTDGKSSLALIGLTTVLVLGMLLFARREIRHRKMGTAIISVAIAGIFGTAADAASWIGYHRLDAFGLTTIIPFFAVIGMVGMLADLRSLVLTTTLINAFTLGIILLAPQLPASSVNPLFIGVVLLIFQWLLAALMVAVQQGFQRLLNELENTYEHSRQLDSLKDAFISSVNHEIRTPLTSMVMYIETLKHQHHRLPQEQLQFGLDRASDIGQSLTDLVKSILSTRQIEHEATDISLEAIPLLRLLNHTLTLLDPKESGKVARDLRLLISPTVIVWGDHVKLQQVLLNLLSNALKYSEPGTPIEIKAAYVRLEVPIATRAARSRLITQEMVEIAIRDYGHGIAPDQIPLLFQKFVRLPADLASKVMGNGLGLYLCRILIEAMQGTIWVESAGEGHGSTFFFRLPVPPPQYDALRNVATKPVRT